METFARNRYIAEYNREKAVNYAHRWALKRNPAFFDFEKSGGDCTNFASQVIYAGSGVMNYTPVYGWYYVNINSRTASWSGVNFLYDFIVNNKGVGPFATIVDVKDILPGDIAQLSFTGGNVFQHSPVIVQTGNPPAVDNILISTHTDDQDSYPITGYEWKNIRFIHILGVRK
ncbi:MAG: amidase domain-containing protein [Bacillota bacterium]|nr:amidase domain-containing protein [Bacillota bacterium]